MINKEDKFEYQEFFLTNNNSIIKIIICKTNQEIIIKSNNYEVKLNQHNIENLMQTKFESIEKVYNFFLNLFQLNSIMIKEIIINKSMTLTFIQNGKIKEIILLYNSDSKNITHYELNSEFKNLFNDIAQIKNEVHEMSKIINSNQNKKEDNEQAGFYISKSDFQILKNFLVDNLLLLIDNQINKQENIIEEKEKKINEYQDIAKQLLKEGKKQECKEYLLLKKITVDSQKNLQGAIGQFKEQKRMLESNKLIGDIISTLKCSQKISEKYFENINKEKLNLTEEKNKNEINQEENINQIKEDDNNINSLNKKIEQIIKLDQENSKEVIDTLKKANFGIKLDNQEMKANDLETLQNRIDNLKKNQDEINEELKEYEKSNENKSENK